METFSGPNTWQLRVCYNVSSADNLWRALCLAHRGLSGPDTTVTNTQQGWSFIYTGLPLYVAGGRSLVWRVGGAASCPGCHCLACILNKLPCCDPLCGAVLSSWQEYIDLRSVLICSSHIQSCTHNSARTWSSVPVTSKAALTVLHVHGLLFQSHMSV